MTFLSPGLLKEEWRIISELKCHCRIFNLKKNLRAVMNLEHQRALGLNHELFGDALNAHIGDLYCSIFA